MVKKLGEGSFAVVMLAKRLKSTKEHSNELFAIKGFVKSELKGPSLNLLKEEIVV
jgi:serine/threonine protein kinase